MTKTCIHYPLYSHHRLMLLTVPQPPILENLENLGKMKGGKRRGLGVAYLPTCRIDSGEAA